MIDTLELVEVEWMDACEMEAGWHTLDDIKDHTICPCRDVGWLVPTDRDDQVVIMASFSGNLTTPSDDVDQGGRVTAIPKPWIVKIRKLVYHRD